MMYLSPAVRTIQKDPTPDVEVLLVIRPSEGALDDEVAYAVGEQGGTVQRETRFGALHVTVPESAVAGLLDALPENIAAVETVTLGVTGDAGEDVDLSE